VTTDRWQRIEQIFLEASERPAAERIAFVRARCGEDSELQREVESLLDSELRGSRAGFLGRSVIGAAGPRSDCDAADIGRLIGPYRLVERIGAGGMGTVWLAERADEQFEQQVALKLIRAELDSDEMLQRFRNERQLLARLNHPNICRLLDGGVDDRGRPYLVMERVSGLPIDAYCDAHMLGIRQRLELFREVCEAVQHAHQHLVVHRDLKPSNILMTADGAAKLLDFGIAKVLQEDAQDRTSMTIGPQRHFTPAYASPEQVRGEAITTASDVYSLGVVLYELLTGRRPYRLTTGSAVEIESIVCNTQPMRPSEIISEPPAPGDERGAPDSGQTPSEIAARRATDSARLARTLRGDLDSILMTALRKEPHRRYSSVTAFAADIERYLSHQPVSARPDSWGYRASMFIRRNRKAAVATGAILALLLAGTIAVSVLALRLAERSDALAEALEVARANEAEAETQYIRALSAAFMYTGMIDGLAASDDAVRARIIEELTKRSNRLDAPAVSITPSAEISSREAIGRIARSIGAHAIGLHQFERIIELAGGAKGEERASLNALSAAGATCFDMGDYERAAEFLFDTIAAQPGVLLQGDDLLYCEALLALERRDEAVAAANRAAFPAPPFDAGLRAQIEDLESRYDITLIERADE